MTSQACNMLNGKGAKMAALAVALALTQVAFGSEPLIEWDATVHANVSTRELAPYMIGSLNHGKNAQGNAAYIDLRAVSGLDTTKKFSYGFGAEVLAGLYEKASYDHYYADRGWAKSHWSPGNIRLHQLYADIKYRSLFLTIGLKEHESALLPQRLSSGDFVESGNTRPMPEVRAGFIDFQDIPYTDGWVQIQGEISYAKMIDKSYFKHQFSYYSGHVNFGAFYTYKRCYFRSRPSERFSVTFGMQAGAMFGGTTYYYDKGTQYKTQKFSRSVGTFLKMLLPMGENGEDYYVGSTLGSWNLSMRYRLQSDDELRFYFQGPWEDGSSIARLNKWDGLFGLEYKWARKGWLTAVVIEYIDFRDQSGPIHYDPADHPDNGINSQATGRDNYYNNNYYNAYAYFGMGIGTPFLVSPIYNRDGFPEFACNRSNGFHIGVSGEPSSKVAYRLLATYQRGLGTYNYPFYEAKKSFSMLVGVDYNASAFLEGLKAQMQVAFDRGKLRGNNFGSSVSLTYSF